MAGRYVELPGWLASQLALVDTANAEQFADHNYYGYGLVIPCSIN